jgi:hypothetical protein
MTADRIRVSGKPKQKIDADLLMQAILLIAEQQLRELQADGDHDHPDGEDRRKSA